MKNKFVKPIIFTLLTSVLVFAAVAIRNRLTTPEKIIVEGEGLWLNLTFEQVVQTADRIVYGKVTGFGEVIVIENKVNEAVTNRQVHTPVNIEVIEWIKGSIPTETVTFYQAGGETDTHIYVDADVDPVSKGEYVLLFINERGGRIIANSVLKTEDGNIAVPAGMLPSNSIDSMNLKSNISTNESIAVSDYIKLIETVMD